MSISLDHLKALVLVAGMSGAGKSVAIDTLADLGFFVIDNLPVPLLPNILSLSAAAPQKYARTAILADIDSTPKLEELLTTIRAFGGARNYHLIFLDCRSEMLLKRYSETRRPHPGFDPLRDKSLNDTIQRERNRLIRFKEIAHLVLDTSESTVHDLRRELRQFSETLLKEPLHKIRVNFLSFGFRYGVPLDCDLVVDVRFLPNPHFIDHLRPYTGLDQPVADYVLNSPVTAEFLDRYGALLEFLLPKYAFEGKAYLNVGVGCTGGKHRSVTLAEALHRRVACNDYLLSVKHRDINR